MSQSIVLVILVPVLVALLVGLYKYFSLKSELRALQSSFESRLQLQFEQWRQTREVQIHKDAVERSRLVTIGEVTEHVAPFFPQFHYNPKDARFIGSPLDLVVFDGLDEGVLRKIVFVEVKTGSANLNAHERSIQKAIQEKLVEFAVLRILPSGAQWQAG
jgi:predicted Holliday junction resolvase-like endonuclease